MSRRLVLLVATAGLIAGGASLVQLAHAADTPLPVDYPSVGCFTLSDPKADAQYNVDGLAKLPNDPDLDILGVALETTDTSLKAYIKVDQLSAAGPNTADGHRFTLDFTFNKHVFSAAGSDYASGSSGQIRDGLAQTGQAGHITQLGVDVPSVTAVPPQTDKGFKDSGLKVTFDYTNSWVVVDLPIADIQKYGGATFGGTLTAVDAKSATDQYAVSSVWDTTTKDNAAGPSTDSWNVGDNNCFGPAAASLTNVGLTTVQFTDSAKVGAKLLGADGQPLAGRPMRFTIGSATAISSTGTDGVATAVLKPKGVAGTYSLVTSFAGDTAAGKATLATPFTVTEEGTALKLSSTRTQRPTVTAVLRDDDGHALAGQRVSWLVNGKKFGGATTNKAGAVSLKGTTKGQTITAVFARVKGEFRGATAKRRV